MSPLLLLVVASVGAALAFFVSGLLLRRPAVQKPAELAEPAEQVAELTTLTEELARLRVLHQQARDALAETERLRQLDAQEADEARRGLTRERDSALTEGARLLARERTLADRLRAAEDSGRAALEQVETNAAGWDARWQAAKTERERHEQALAKELAQLRERCDRQAKEKAKEQQEAELRERNLRDLELTVAEWQDKHARAEATWQATLASQQAAWENKVATSEASWQTRLEAASHAQQGNASTLQLEKQQLTHQLRQCRDDQARAHEQNQQLALALRTAEETLGSERAEAKTAALALRTAEERLRDWERLTRENAELREERAQAADEAKWAVGRDGEVKDARVELAAAQAKLAELGEVLQENRKLRDEVGELRLHQAASDELERLTAAHKQLRLDAELMARRLQELKHDQAELVPLRAQAAEAASLEEEVIYLRRREKDLEAQIYASGFYASREIPVVSGELLVRTPVSNMETSLHALLGAGGPRTAVLADSQGFLIAGAGESVAQEGLAAFAAVAGEMVSRARMLLPLAEVHAVRVTDANSIVLTCHLFNSEEQGLGIATLGPGEPSLENTQHAVVELAAIISGDGDDTNDTNDTTSGGEPGAPGQG